MKNSLARQSLTFVFAGLTIFACVKQPEESGPSAVTITGTERPDADLRPNILFILADDLGYLDPGFMGGEIKTPNLDQLASNGLLLTNVHASPNCAPTRAMLFSGMSNVEAGVKGLDDPLRSDVATLAERMQDAGYQTLMAGKWNLGFEAKDGPSARGFDRAFALMKAGDTHLGPSLFPGSPPSYEGQAVYLADGTPVDLPEDRFSTELYTDKFISYLETRDPEIPWFGFLAYTAPHWPMQAPDDWIDRYAGQYDAGYTVVRDERVARAQSLGVLPDGLSLAGYQAQSDRWQDVPKEKKERSIRAMEVYAAMVENMDMHIGRLLQFLEANGELHNTAIIFASDNGAEDIATDYIPRTLPRVEPDSSLENIGRAGSYPIYGPGWAEAAMAPYRDMKGTLYSGGTIVPTIVHHPSIADKGGKDHTYITFMDMLPTMMDIAQSEDPDTTFRGRTVRPIRGSSFWALVTGNAESVRGSDDMVPWYTLVPAGNNARSALVSWPWKIIAEGDREKPERWDWELYNLETDPGERTDLAEKREELTARLVARWLEFRSEF